MVRTKINWNLGIGISFFALVIGVLLIPGQVTEFSVLLGFPLRFITIYERSFDMLVVGTMPIGSIAMNAIPLVGNLIIFLLLYKFIWNRYHVHTQKVKKSTLQ